MADILAQFDFVYTGAVTGKTVMGFSSLEVLRHKPQPQRLRLFHFALQLWQLGWEGASPAGFCSAVHRSANPFELPPLFSSVGVSFCKPHELEAIMANAPTGTSAQITPSLAIVDGVPTTTSLDIAKHFDRRHDNVLTAIRSLLAQLPTERLLNFKETLVARPNPNGGAPINTPLYHITRDGFTLLAMGFTSKRALAFKLAYIDAFNQMEATLRNPAPAPAPTQSAENHLRNQRFLLSFDTKGQSRLTPVAKGMCLVDPDSESSLRTLLGEFLPAAYFGLALQVVSERVQRQALALNRPDPADDPHTRYQEAAKWVLELMRIKGRDTAVKLLALFDVQRLPDVPGDKLPAVTRAARACLEA